MWQLIVVGLAVATVALPAALWLQARERTDVEVELPPIGIHYVYPMPILGCVLLVAGISVGDLKLAGLGIVVMALSGGGLWLAWRRRRRYGA